LSLDNRKSLEPWVKDDVQYYTHQIQAVRDLAKRKSFILADDMGLGKSLEALTIFAVDVFRGWVSSMLVVCPVTLKGNWADEIEKFTGFNYQILEGSPDQRNKQILEFYRIQGPKILITNYEQIRVHGRALDAIQFDVAVFDEAHYLQNPESQRTLASLDVFAHRNFMLTGTPMLNHIQNLWVLLHKVDPAGFPDYYRFVNRYAVFGGYKNKTIIGVKNEEELIEKLHNIMYRRTKDEVLDLPDVQYIERRVDLYPEQQKLYDQIKNELKAERFGQMKPDEIKNHLTKFLRLKEVCGTTIDFTGEDISSKLDLAVMDDIELLENGHKVVVFTQFRPVQACYVRRLKEKMKDTPVWTLNGDTPKSGRQPMVKEWGQSSNPGVLCAMIQVGGEGLNMTAARHGSFLDKLFTPGKNQQGVDRLHRIGANKTQPVQIREYIARDTVEKRVNDILKNKKKIFGEIIETDPLWKKKMIEAIMEE
jgi:SNF2 family DNA or RNA helicase